MTYPSARTASSFVNRFVLLASYALLCTTAHADITVENLVSNSVAGVGPYYQDLQDAIRKSAGRDFAGALAHLEEAKKKTPKLPPPEAMMAQLFFEANQPAQAYASLEKAIARVPEDPEALVILAERAVRDNRTTDAGLLAERAGKVLDAFKDNPKRKEHLQGRVLSIGAAADEAVANFPQAQQKLEQLVKLEPTDVTFRQRLARVLFRAGKQKEAYAEFQTAFEMDPKLPPAELAMALLTADTTRAEQWLKLAVQKGEKNLRTQISAAEYCIRTNQIDEAKQHAENALKLEADNLSANNLAGMVARLMADYPSAEKHFSKAHLLAPADLGLMNQLALVLVEMPDKASQMRGLQFAELGARLRPNDSEAIATLGWAYFKLGRLTEAEQAFNVVLNSAAAGNRGTVNAEMGYYLANIAQARGRTAEAVRLLGDSLNNNQQFIYRKPAQELLVELQKLAAPSSTTKAGQGAGKK